MDLLNYFVPKRSVQQPFQPQTQTGQPQAEFDPTRLGPKESYFVWSAPGRAIHKGYNEKLMRTFAIIGVFVALFLVILQEYLLILVVVSMIFVGHVLAKTPPEDSKFELSSYGVSIDDQTYYWHELRRFFFFNQDGYKVLAIDLINGFPSRLFLTINEADLSKIQEILGQRLQFLESVPETLLDKTYKSVSSKFAS